MVLQQNDTDKKTVNRLSSAKKIGLMGPFGFGNLGDGAIQQAMLQNIESYCPEAQVHGFSLNPNDTEKRHGIPSFPICKYGDWAHRQWWQGNGNNKFIVSLDKIHTKIATFPNKWLRRSITIPLSALLEVLAWWRAFKTLKGFDALIVSGGGQLDDYWGGPWVHPFTLLMWGFLAKLNGTKYLIVSVGAGPLDRPLSRLFTKATLSLADYRSFRDEDSKKYIERVVGFSKDDPVYPDLAHSLKLTNYLNTPIQTKYRPIVVGIGPMTYFDPRVWPEKDGAIYWGYLTKLASFVSWLIQKQYGILFFTGEALCDRPVIKDLRNILPKNGITYSEGQIIEEPIETVDDLMTQLAMTDLVVASRFHGVLLSQLMNKPVLALSYHPKIDMLMTDTGQSNYCLSIDTFEVDALKERFIALEANRESIKEQLTQRTQKYQAALDEQYQRIFKHP